MKNINTILVVLDTLRRDHLGCYSYHRNVSPNIDKLAEKGVTFDNEYTSDVPTIPSFTAMLNGRLGIKTGVVSFDDVEVLSPKAESLPYILARNGVATAGVSTLFYMRQNLVRGFQYHLNPLAGVRERTQTVDAEEINTMAIPWITQNYKKKFFLFIHYWDPHQESVWEKPSTTSRWIRYKAPEHYRQLYYQGQPKDIDEREYVISQYDANITYADEEIGKIFQTLDDLGITDETLVIFTTDHGESLGDDHPMTKNLWDHFTEVYEAVIHTPLIMRFPLIFPHGKRIDALVQNIDIAATILDIYGIIKPDDLDGKSLIPLIQGEVSEIYREIYASTGVSNCKRAIVTRDKLKFIRTLYKARWPDSPSRELFDLEKDPREQNNLVDEREELADRLETQMLRWVDSMLGSRPDPLRSRVSRVSR